MYPTGCITLVVPIVGRFTDSYTVRNRPRFEVVITLVLDKLKSVDLSPGLDHYCFVFLMGHKAVPPGIV